MGARVPRPHIEIEPVISYPRQAEAGQTYVMTVDLRQRVGAAEWPYEEEEYVVHCMLDSVPLFSNEPVGEPSVVLHRFGGTYGPAMFLLTAGGQQMHGRIRLTLVSEWGVPIDVIELPEIRVTEEKLKPRASEVQFTRESSGSTYTPAGQREQAAEPAPPPASLTDSPPGLKLRHALRGDAEHELGAVGWSPDGKFLAVPQGGVHVWDAARGLLLRTLTVPTARYDAHSSASWSPDGTHLAYDDGQGGTHIWETRSWGLVRSIRFDEPSGAHSAWSPDGGRLAVVSGASTIHILDAGTWQALLSLRGHRRRVLSLAWSPDGLMLASGGAGDNIRIWETATGREVRRLEGPSRLFNVIIWSPDGRTLAAGTDDHAICLWEAETGALRYVLENHTGSITGLSFSADVRLLASKSSDGNVKLWRCDKWAQVAAFAGPTSDTPAAGLAFHPTDPALATPSPEQRAVSIWDLDLDALLRPAPPAGLYNYSTAKVVLLGDTGVGKSGLAHALVGRSFTPTESTHGRRVWRFESGTAPHQDHVERREIFLWDLAGQLEYRLLHQLQLTDVALALIVFDARGEGDPLAGARYWERALRQSQRASGKSSTPVPKLLVAARVDVGHVAISRERLTSFLNEHGFHGYHETSARLGLGIEELAQAIRESIDWSRIPITASTELFNYTRDFLMSRKEKGLLLAPLDELYDAFLSSREAREQTSELRPQFEASVARLESHGLIRRLRAGNYVLMQPEIIDLYASAVIDAVRSEPNGVGAISEASVLGAHFRMPSEERVGNKEWERIILADVVEQFLRSDIAWRELFDNEAVLIFPSLVSRRSPEFSLPAVKESVLSFEGSLQNIYATLAVKLFRGGVFSMKQMWGDGFICTAADGSECGVSLREIEEGHGTLSLSFDESATPDSKAELDEFVYTHLRQHAIPESVHRWRPLACPKCAKSLDEVAILLRREGYDSATCPKCGTRVALPEPDADPGSAVAPETATPPPAQEPEGLAPTTSDPRLKKALEEVRAAVRLGLDQLAHLTDYLRLHDLLHELRFRVYSPLTGLLRRGQQSPDDLSARDELAVHQTSVEGVVSSLQSLATTSPTATGVRFLPELINDLNVLAEALTTDNPAQVQKALRPIHKTLAIQPALVSERAYAVARSLASHRITGALRRLVRAIAGRGGGDEFSTTARQVMESMPLFDARLDRALQELTVWQQIDNQLQLIESNIGIDTSELEELWPSLKVWIEERCLKVEDHWASRLLDRVGRLEGALAKRDLFSVRGIFSEVRASCDQRLYKVAAESLMFCDNLREALGRVMALTEATE